MYKGVKICWIYKAVKMAPVLLYLGEDSSRKGQQWPPKDEDSCQQDAPDPNLALGVVQRFDWFLLGNCLFLQGAQRRPRMSQDESLSL